MPVSYAVSRKARFEPRRRLEAARQRPQLTPEERAELKAAVERFLWNQSGAEW
jgi:hypothetical protein